MHAYSATLHVYDVMCCAYAQDVALLVLCLLFSANSHVHNLHLTKSAQLGLSNTTSAHLHQHSARNARVLFTAISSCALRCIAVISAGRAALVSTYLKMSNKDEFKEQTFNLQYFLSTCLIQQPCVAQDAKHNWLLASLMQLKVTCCQ